MLERDACLRSFHVKSRWQGAEHGLVMVAMQGALERAVLESRHQAGAALGIYEELQLWDALVVCYRLLDKRGAAEDLLKRRLKVRPANKRTQGASRCIGSGSL
eukprot:1144571-Pelagomonas_calceolata.AAC.4